jgi:hypothetical protein
MRSVTDHRGIIMGRSDGSTVRLFAKTAGQIRRSASARLSHSPIWFQFAKVRVTNSNLLIPNSPHSIPKLSSSCLLFLDAPNDVVLCPARGRTT